MNGDMGQAGATSANITLGTARDIGEQQTSAAAARASGYASRGNILGGTLSNIGGTILDQFTLNDLLKRVPIQSFGNA